MPSSGEDAASKSSTDKSSGSTSDSGSSSSGSSNSTGSSSNNSGSGNSSTGSSSNNSGSGNSSSNNSSSGSGSNSKGSGNSSSGSSNSGSSAAKTGAASAETTHQHTWKAHTATRQVWVPKMVTVPDYVEQQVKVGEVIRCVCGAEFTADEMEEFEMHSVNHLLAGEADNYSYVPVYETQKVQVGSHTEDQGHYETETYTDYYYCECGATKK